jgi:hypothetical protein
MIKILEDQCDESRNAEVGLERLIKDLENVSSIRVKIGYTDVDLKTKDLIPVIEKHLAELKLKNDKLRDKIIRIKAILEEE